MARIAALTTADHPWHAQATPGPAGLGLVADPDGADGDRRCRYDLASAWCAAGPCLPVPWAWPLDARHVARLDVDPLEDLRAAVRDAADRAEWAFQVCSAAPSNLSAPTPSDDGRAYLAAIKRRAPVSVRLDPALRREADGLPFALEAVSDRDGLLTGILVGRRHDAPVWAVVLDRVLRELLGAEPSVAGPLPPFASGAAALRSVGLGPCGPRRPQ